MRKRFAAALAVAFACTSMAHAAGKGSPPPTGPVGDPTPPSATFYEDKVAGTTGVGSTGVGVNAVPVSPLGATTYTTAFNGVQQGGISANGAVTQATPLQKIGQVFTATGGTLNQISFVDTNGALGGEELRLAKFDPTSFTASDQVLYSSSTSLLTGYGDRGGVGGVDALAYHTWTDINYELTAGEQYYAYVVSTPGSNVFNGSNSRYQSGAYFFGLATEPSALEGQYVFQFNNFVDEDGVLQEGEYRNVAGSPGKGPLQALYRISITPSATAAVPEPASWAMMVAGFGLAGYSLRRRRPARPGVLAA